MTQIRGRKERLLEVFVAVRDNLYVHFKISPLFLSSFLFIYYFRATCLGYAESISFNVSSVLPLSPIAPSNKLGTYQRKSARNKPAREDVAAGGPVDKGKRRSKRLRTMEEEEMAKKQADIILPSPDAKYVKEARLNANIKCLKFIKTRKMQFWDTAVPFI